MFFLSCLFLLFECHLLLMRAITLTEFVGLLGSSSVVRCVDVILIIPNLRGLPRTYVIPELLKSE